MMTRKNNTADPTEFVPSDSGDAIVSRKSEKIKNWGKREIGEKSVTSGNAAKDQ